MSLGVRDSEPSDHEWARDLIARYSGGSHMIARLGELVDPLAKPGIVVEQNGRPVALATIDETERGLELLTMHSEVPGIGAGTLLLETTMQVAVASGSRGVWLVTTNDNLPAIHFYLRRGMRVAAVHAGAVDRDRRALKPQIATVNPGNGISIRDYVELELPTWEGETLPFLPFPRLEDLNALPPEPAADALAPLFEGAPRFLARLAATRPFASDGELLATARDIGRSMPEEEQVELLEAHPRIGADPAGVSELSRHEQGYGDEERMGDGERADPDAARIREELEMLNEIYERRFGFRFVIFVAGRPKAEIVPLLERAITLDREEELARGVDDTVHIAGERLAVLRAQRRAG